MDDFALREIYINICNGFSEAEYKGKPIYIKHLDQFDQLLIEKEKHKCFNVAKSKKIPTIKEKLEWLDSERIWTKKDEVSIQREKSYLDSLRAGKNNLIVKAQIRQRQKEIEEAEKKIGELDRKRNSLIGLTAEKFAEQRVEGYYIYNTFYKDSTLSKKLLTLERFRELEDEEIEEFLQIYYLSLVSNSITNIKKISISYFFTHFYNLSETGISFFGKPVSQLTFNQVNLLSYADYFKKIISNNSIPPDIINDPDKIEEFVMRANNAEKYKNKNNVDGGRVAIIGATKEDSDVLGGYELRDTSIDKINKKGGATDVWEANSKK